MKNMTAYAAAKIANAILEDEGLEPIRPQMIYNYVRKGYIEHVEVDGKKYLELETFATWLKGYVDKKKNTVDHGNVEENVEEVRNLMGM